MQQPSQEGRHLLYLRPIQFQYSFFLDDVKSTLSEGFYDN